MTHALVQDGQVVSTRLPRTGTLLDGRTASGFDKSDDATFKKEGWLSIDNPGPLERDIEIQVYTFALKVFLAKPKAIRT